MDVLQVGFTSISKVLLLCVVLQLVKMEAKLADTRNHDGTERNARVNRHSTLCRSLERTAICTRSFLESPSLTTLLQSSCTSESSSSSSRSVAA